MSSSINLRSAKPRKNKQRATPEGGAPVNRRAGIIEVATKRFSKFGFEATTVRQIADDMNILSGSLYHHFATKDEILHEIVKGVVFQMRNNTLRIYNAPVDAERRLVALVLLDLGELTRNQQVYTLLYNERKFFAKSEEFSYVLRAKTDVYVSWSSILREGIRDRLFTRDIDVYLTTITIVRMLNAAADSYLNADGTALDTVGNYTLDGLKDFYLKFILRAVRDQSRTLEIIPRQDCEELARFRICDDVGCEQDLSEASADNLALG